ncbi:MULTISPECIES: acyltransferase family protein [Stenotrophomonas]|uniref:Acyltransferase n=1 Tax=Stenotrophomonas maltophilia TaxID=40324 RepID=A0A431UN20_STEMA|nr:acyltransferase [Stenotrophomonas maltophilia]RTQ91259.1 acyltransferase [Stenotrophomonas maltophilia]
MLIDLYSPFVPAGIALLAMVCALPLGKFVPLPDSKGRATSIDGLRGLLALSVFVHHSSIWYVYARSGEWKSPASALYAQLGEAAVALFFMISAFLFYRQIAGGVTDWTRLYVGRVLRMFPLYAICVVVVLLLVLIESDFHLVDPLVQFGVGVIQWFSFTVLGAPDINGVVGTRYIMAGVVWTLPYEWVWYAVLPLLAYFLRQRVQHGLLLLSALGLAYAAVRLSLVLMLPFVGGVAAYYATTRMAIASFLRGRWGSILAISCMILSVICFDSARHPAAVALWSVFFAAIACGNSLFGLLTLRVSAVLGELSYGIYLLHGFVLFLAYKGLGAVAFADLSPASHWALTTALLLPLLIACLVSYRCIELPSMRSRRSVLEKLQVVSEILVARWRDLCRSERVG